MTETLVNGKWMQWISQSVTSVTDYMCMLNLQVTITTHCHFNQNVSSFHISYICMHCAWVWYRVLGFIKLITWKSEVTWWQVSRLTIRQQSSLALCHHGSKGSTSSSWITGTLAAEIICACTAVPLYVSLSQLQQNRSELTERVKQRQKLQKIKRVTGSQKGKNTAVTTQYFNDCA
jgi:hypothetical protein